MLIKIISLISLASAVAFSGQRVFYPYVFEHVIGSNIEGENTKFTEFDGIAVDLAQRCEDEIADQDIGIYSSLHTLTFRVEYSPDEIAVIARTIRPYEDLESRDRVEHWIGHTFECRYQPTRGGLGFIPIGFKAL